ncbi:MAG: Uma2 family endonuclease [Caldilineaceae bacterium]|nr:Uma2 family endonuclease [Caldilineaceae bacterium]
MAINTKLAKDIERIVLERLPDMLKDSPLLQERLRQVLNTPAETLTYEEFLDRYADLHAEWEQGKVILMSPASDKHQDLVGFLSAILRIYVESRQLGWMRTAPFQMKLQNGREPDILFVANEHLDRVKPTHVDGAADLVIEVISPESIERDRGRKFLEFEEAAIPEYWLLDPLREQAEFYHLTDGRYKLILPQEGVYYSQILPGLWLDVSWLWEDPLPPVLDVLRALKLI